MAGWSGVRSDDGRKVEKSCGRRPRSSISLSARKGSHLESDGERGVFADLVLHCTDGFVEGGDDKVAGSAADDLADVDRVVVDGERDGSGYVGGCGEGCSFGVETE